jgi:hypothetical protein
MKAVLTSVRHLDQLLLLIRPLGQPTTSVVLSTVVEHPIAHPSTTDSGDEVTGTTRTWVAELETRSA